MIVKEIMEDEDIQLRLNELAIESDPEFKKERGDRSLADEESDGGFKQEIEGKNAEDIVLRLNKMIRDINSDFKAEHDDQREDLNDHRSLADEEWVHAEDLDIDPTDEEWNSSDDGESQETKKKLEEIDPFDSGLGTVEVLEEIVVEYHEFVDYAIEMFKDGEKKKREECGRVLLQLSWSLNKGYKRVHNEMQWLKKNNEIETLESYFKKRPYINKIFSVIEDVIATIYRCIEEDLSLCADELNQWKAELGEWILRIRELKANMKNNAQGNGGIEA